MATTYNHVQLSVVNENGNVDVLYPQNNANDVSINRSSNSKIPSDVKDVQGFVDNVGEMAFIDKNKMVFLGESDEYNGPIETSEINDGIIDDGTTWSSKKINDSTTTIKMNISEVKDVLSTPNSPKVITFTPDHTSLIGAVPGNLTGYYWIVEYFPINIVNGEVSVAYQRWTGISSSNGSIIQRYKVYMNKSWSARESL